MMSKTYVISNFIFMTIVGFLFVLGLSPIEICLLLINIVIFQISLWICCRDGKNKEKQKETNKLLKQILEKEK